MFNRLKSVQTKSVIISIAAIAVGAVAIAYLSTMSNEDKVVDSLVATSHNEDIHSENKAPSRQFDPDVIPTTGSERTSPIRVNQVVENTNQFPAKKRIIKRTEPVWPRIANQEMEQTATKLEKLPVRLGETSNSNEKVAFADDSASTDLKIKPPPKTRMQRKAARGSHPDKSVEFRNLQMRDEKGKIPLDGMYKAKLQMDQMRLAQTNSAAASKKPDGTDVAGLTSLPWTWLGPGNIGGRTRSIAIHPTDPNRIWLGSVSGGIWYTNNAGASWSPVDDFMANLAVSSLIIDPTNPNIMYAGTGESFAASFSREGEQFAPDGLRGDGIFKTTDGGTSWIQLPRTRTSDPTVCSSGGPVCPWSYVNRIAISPDGSTLLAATINGLHRSTDGGVSWVRSTIAGLVTNVQDVDFHPTDSLSAIASGPNNISYSTDGGTNFLASTGSFAGRVEVAYAQSNPLIVYASVDVPTGTAANPSAGAVFQSSDGGQSFIRLAPTSPVDFLGSQGFYDNVIWINPQDPTHIIVGGIALNASTDGGNTWTIIADGANSSAHADHHIIVAHPAFDNVTNKTVYFGNDGGIYRADDVSTVSRTSGWTNLNNSLGITQFYGGAVNSAGVFIGGTQDNGTLRYTGNPLAWTSMYGGDGGFSAADPTDSNYFYAEYIFLGILRSTDGGASSSYIYCDPLVTLPGGQVNPNGGACVSPSTGITDAFNGANFIAPFILDPNDPNSMLAGGLSLWRSGDIKAVGLPSWVSIKPPVLIPQPAPAPPAQNPISAIAVSRNSSDLIVVGHNDGQVFLSTNGTTSAPTWTKIDSGLPSRFVTRLVIDDSKAPSLIYAAFGGFSDDNVYRSSDLGVTWTDISGEGTFGLPSVPIRVLTISPANSKFLYVGTEVGIFASEDGGATWRLPQSGPANVSVDDLLWSDGFLVAVTHGRGFFKTSSGVFDLPTCTADPDCSCAGEWSCPCNWGSGVPNETTDVFIACPIIIDSNFARARNITIENDMRLNNGHGLSIAEEMVNRGQISAGPNGQFSRGGINAGTLGNFRPAGLTTTAGIIDVGNVTTAGKVINSGLMSVDNDLSVRDVTLTRQSTLTAKRILASGDLINNSTTAITVEQIFVEGSIHNDGAMNATIGLGLDLGVTGSVPRPHTFSGLGSWNFGTFLLPSGHTVTLANGIRFGGGQFINRGTFNIQNNTFEFSGSKFDNFEASVLGNGIVTLKPITGVNLQFNSSPGTLIPAIFTPELRITEGIVETPASTVIDGQIIINKGATLALNQTVFIANDRVNLDGTLTTIGNPANGAATFVMNGPLFWNNGSVTQGSHPNFTFRFNNTNTPRTIDIRGNGTWDARVIQIGSSLSVPTTVNIRDSVIFGGNQFLVNGPLNLLENDLIYTGATVSQAAPVSGTGSFTLRPSTGGVTMAQVGGARPFSPKLVIDGTGATATLNSTFLDGDLHVMPGNALRYSNLTVRGDATIDGSINEPGPTFFTFTGPRFSNNGSVNARMFFNSSSGTELSGTGSWTGTTSLLNLGAASFLTLQNDVTYSGTTIIVGGPEGRIFTGGHTLSMPCTTALQGTGEIFGSVRRTSLSSCPGASYSFGNPFTTVQFTSGTPPSELTCHILSGPPIGFSNAVHRTYIISPFGGNNYTANLRLHYLDSELNGNAESTLQLWRSDGTSWAARGVTSRSSTDNWVEYTGVSEFSPWAISGQLGPTAAGVGVSGQVRNAGGMGISGALVTITAKDGSVRQTRSNNFGYYRFENVLSGQSYIISVVAKSYVFAKPTVVISVFDEFTNVDFISEPL